LNGSDPVRILYLAGWGRSGSTILGALVGQAEGCFFGGELWYLGQRGWAQNYLCGCGKPFRECEVWSEVTSRLRKELGDSALTLLEALPGSTLRTRSLLMQVLFGRMGIPSGLERRTLDVLEKLYREIAAVSAASVIIDTSKAPMYGMLLEKIPSVQLSVVHLVRDPRGTGYSMRKRKYDPAGRRYLPRAGALQNGVLWLTWNLAAEVLWNRRGSKTRYLRVRYEDFARNPDKGLRTVLDFLGLQSDLHLISGPADVTLRATHSVSGNPDRMKTESIEIKIDDEWRSRMAWHQKGQAVLLTWPLLLRYSYRLWA